MSWLELNSALSATVFRKRLEEPGEYSFVSKFSSRECRGKPQIVQLLKTEGEAWETIMSCKKADEEVKAFEKRVRNQLGTVPFRDIKTEKEANDYGPVSKERGYKICTRCSPENGRKSIISTMECIRYLSNAYGFGKSSRCDVGKDFDVIINVILSCKSVIHESEEHRRL